MQFKVGDRVEAIKPPNGVEESQADQIGWGKLLSINPAGEYGETHEVQLDTGEEWWYSEDRLRHPIVSKPTPTPSITVGTQVRLTGVVAEGYEDFLTVLIQDPKGRAATQTVTVPTDTLEVIRQPFKRGEVVYHVVDKDSEPRTVVTDEAEGFVLLARHVHGTETLEWDATSFERRP